MPEERPTKLSQMCTVPSLFEQDAKGRIGADLPDEPSDTGEHLAQAIPAHLLRSGSLPIPELSEPAVVRHFTRLSSRVLGVDTTFYPLGSCTMKYNPKVNEVAASLEGFTHVHPAQPQSTVQGVLRICYELQEALGTLTGLPAVSLQPPAGAHGEFTALLMIRAYFEDRGESQRREVIIPDTAHGTNPASAARCGFVPVALKSSSRGRIDPKQLADLVGPQTACLMITNPNTLGLFEDQITEVAELVHQAGALIYMDGANFNALVARVRPADCGADLMHINLHKTFSVPHGGGGPGAGPICVREFLRPYLPTPRVEKTEERYCLTTNHPKSIGRVRSFLGNVLNVVRSYTYIRQLGVEGLRDVSGHAVLNANYLLALLHEAFEVPFGRRCMHEFVLSATRQKHNGVKAMDIAKKLLDYGFHPPTTYFPLIVPEALMVEPTETENQETLVAFAQAMLEIARLAEETPHEVTSAPRTTPVDRLDELAAARNPVLVWPQNPCEQT
ncbi:MAG: putative glycine dehydrogenase (decarboxylating) subunit 2 [Candidatus Sumerlaea sp.]|nr:MAG: putative glycine dehydrogenase (decarboxylating) subunit 2 [Candidatus Sumerlaea sp.]